MEARFPSMTNRLVLEIGNHSHAIRGGGGVQTLGRVDAIVHVDESVVRVSETGNSRFTQILC